MDNKTDNTYFVSGGGTGGHIYPAVAIINELRSRGITDVYYIGNPDNPEKIIAEDNDIKFLPVKVSGMPRVIALGSVIWVIKLVLAILKCCFYVLKYKPKLVFGTGGYVSAPVLFAARFLKVPYAQHDADAQPGVVTRCFSSGAKFLSTPFEVVKNHLPYTNIIVTGNPIRKEFSENTKEEALKKLGLDNKLTLLVMGGSQGARSINSAIIPIAKKLIDEFDITILHQSGKKRYDEALTLLQTYFPDFENCKNYRLFPYIDDMPVILKASDIAISRSGSLSLSEMKSSGVASILVPYPYSASDHQKINAQAMVDEGCSVMIEDSDLTSEKLYEELSELIKNPDKIKTMQDNAISHSMPDATKKIVENLLS